MSEKRFELVEAIYNEIGKQQVEIMDNLEKQIVDKQKVADLLNEQQSKIKDLKFVINFQEKEMDSLKALLKDKEALTEENVQLRIVNLKLQERIDDLEKKRRPMRWSDG